MTIFVRSDVRLFQNILHPVTFLAYKCLLINPILVRILVPSLSTRKILPVGNRAEFSNLIHEYDDVFNPQITGYNDAVGKFHATVNIGPVLPPQHKGRVPQYSRDKLVELQQNLMN